MISVRNRALFHLRSWAWDVSPAVRWLDDPQPFYEDDATVDAYDSVAFEKGLRDTLSTMRGPTCGGLIDYIRRNNLRSVIDIGCGAGAFYHLLSKTTDEVSYRGVDISKKQIARARKNFGSMFEVGDASELTVEDFSKVDAVHVFSVFAFMSVEKQLRTLHNILASRATLITNIGATIPDVSYVPQSAFQNFAKRLVVGAPLLTAVSWPFRDQIDAIIRRHPRYEVVWEETEYAVLGQINGARRNGGAVLADSVSLAKRRRFGNRFLDKPERLKLLNGIIKPQGWIIPDDVPGLHTFKQSA